MTGPGTIILLGGINDMLFVTKSWQYGLRRAGMPHRVIRFIWQQGLWAMLCFADLWNTKHHRREAQRLADLIRRTQAQHPGEPIHIIAHSAGTAITAYAIEILGPNQPITSAMLVGSGLSPRFDLSSALAGTTAGIFTIESWLDCFYLGIGTCLLGTADRHWTPAAGMIGFHEPKNAPQATPLQAHRWKLRDVQTGWLGGHLSIAAPGFVKHILAPWIRNAEQLATSPEQGQ
jgi:pimeloyl-ACP methyl ester carboxylesterase